MHGHIKQTALFTLMLHNGVAGWIQIRKVLPGKEFTVSAATGNLTRWLITTELENWLCNELPEVSQI